MNGNWEIYNKLQILKRVDDECMELHQKLKSRIDKNSKNRLVICRSKKDCREAIKMIAKNYIDRCKVKLSSLKIDIDDITIIFMPVSELEWGLVGYKYKEYYFEEEFHL